MREITFEQFKMEIQLQGMDDKKDAAFICPMCGTVQSYNSFLKAGVEPDKIEGALGFSCIGRFTGAGSPDRGSGNPCNWTLGGLFQTHELTVLTEDGKKVPHFEIAATYQAKELKESLHE